MDVRAGRQAAIELWYKLFDEPQARIVALEAQVTRLQEALELAREYIEELMHTLKRRVSRKRHSNVLQHMMGYLKRSIDSEDKAEILQAIEAYRNEEIPLVVPITLFRHYFRRHPDPYMERQHYLRPHPDKLSLRNAI